MKKSLVVVLVMVTIFFYYVLRDWPDHYFHIIFCDVGQGDAILLTHGFTQMLIDGGRDQSVLRCLGEKLPFWDKKIEIILATHPDADHIGGLTTVFEQYSTDLIITNGSFKNTADFEDFKKGVSRKQSAGTKHFILSKNATLQLSEKITLTSLWPAQNISVKDAENTDFSETRLWDTSSATSENKEDYNNRSIVLFLTYGKTRVLLTGDLEAEGETALLSAGLIKEVDILKVGHHGAKTSTTQNFISLARPEVSVISSGKNNTYGHPTKETLDRLTKMGSHIVRTDTDGSIEYVTNGLEIWRIR